MRIPLWAAPRLHPGDDTTALGGPRVVGGGPPSATGPTGDGHQHRLGPIRGAATHRRTPRSPMRWHRRPLMDLGGGRAGKFQRRQRTSRPSERFCGGRVAVVLVRQVAAALRVSERSGGAGPGANAARPVSRPRDHPDDPGPAMLKQPDQNASWSVGRWHMAGRISGGRRPGGDVDRSQAPRLAHAPGRVV
jgi:hypothetical protein